MKEKLQLIQTAKDNQDSEDWDTAVPLFKKASGRMEGCWHVPRSQSNRVWDEFRDACNHFFAKFREKEMEQQMIGGANYKKKKHFWMSLRISRKEKIVLKQSTESKMNGMPLVKFHVIKSASIRNLIKRSEVR